MKKYFALLLLLLLTGCGFTVNGNVNEIQLAIDRPLCLDVKDASKVSGAQVQVYPCGKAKLSQEWRMLPADRVDSFTIVNANSAMCMSVAETPVSAPGQIVIQETCAAGNSKPNQIWTISPAPHGQSGERIISAASKQCLDLPYGATASVFNMQQYYCTDNDPAQGWVIHHVGKVSTQ